MFPMLGCEPVFSMSAPVRASCSFLVLIAGFGCYSAALSCSDSHRPLRAYGIGRVREIMFPFAF